MAFSRENIILADYMLSTWWLRLMELIGHYIIFPSIVAQIIVMTNNIMNLGYTYYNFGLKNPPNVFCKIAHHF